MHTTSEKLKMKNEKLKNILLYTTKKLRLPSASLFLGKE